MSTLKGYEVMGKTFKYIGFDTKVKEPVDKTKELVKKAKKLNAIKNKTINPRFIELCKFEKSELKAYLEAELKKYYGNVISNDGFLFVKGTDNVCLTAHMDTTNSVEYGKRQLVKDVYEYVENGKHVVYSPQGIGGDDRCGVYMILKILEETSYRPYIIFCEDEEIGCVGSGKFAESKFVDELKDVRFIVQLDRRGNNDAVFYDDVNDDFHAWVEKVTDYKEAIGSCSDISVICPACGVSGVNLSCGYYNEHHDYETVVLEEMERTYEAAVKLIQEGIKLDVPFEYMAAFYGNSFNYDDWFGTSYKRNGSMSGHYSYLDEMTCALYVSWQDKNGKADEEYYDGLFSIAEGWQSFFFDHPEVCFNDVIDFEEYCE